MLKVTNKLKTNIKPDILPLTSCSIERVEGKAVLVVTVSRGTKRPYYLAAKGLRPEGVYVRSGSANLPSSDTAILQMIKESDGETFETQRSLGSGALSRAAIQSQTGLTQATLLRLLKQLIEKNLVIKTGRGKNVRYALSSQRPSDVLS